MARITNSGETTSYVNLNGKPYLENLLFILLLGIENAGVNFSTPRDEAYWTGNGQKGCYLSDRLTQSYPDTIHDKLLDIDFAANFGHPAD